LNDGELQSLREIVRKAAKSEQFGRRARTKTEKILAMRADLLALREPTAKKKKATWTEIADVLKAGGLQVSPDTLRLALGEPKPKRMELASSLDRAKARKNTGQESGVNRDDDASGGAGSSRVPKRSSTAAFEGRELPEGEL
jgi:hypothetical protein